MSIPFFDLKRQYNSIKDEVETVIIATCNSCAYVEGSEVQLFEKEVAEYLNVKHAITCGNGTDSLEISLKACGVNPGDEVITSPFSFFATAEAISAVGAKPVFVDINLGDYNINSKLIEEKVTEKTKAILPVHIFGLPADMSAINAIAKKHGLFVIEDACQAIGSTYNGVKSGSLGDLGAFSFYPTKNLGCFGDGGMITTNDDSLALICRALKAHAGGKVGYDAAKLLGKDIGGYEVQEEKETELYNPHKYYNFFTGRNSRLDSIQASVLRVKLKKLDEYNQRRAVIASAYNDAFQDLPIKLPQAENETKKPCWHQYAILVEEKYDLINHLGDKGIGTGAFYPVPLHLQKAFVSLLYKEGDCPVAEEVCNKSVCLPIFPELEDCEVDTIIDEVRSFFLK